MKQLILILTTLLTMSVAHADQAPTCKALIKQYKLTQTKCDYFDSEERAEIVSPLSNACDQAQELNCDLN